MAKYENLAGQKFGLLTMQEYVGKNKYRQARWTALCDCGNTCTVTGTKAKSGHTTSCGCQAVNVVVDMIGKKFNRLTVLSREVLHTTTDRAYAYKCQCDCGNTTIVLGSKLRNGTTKSCGCFIAEHASTMNLTHGQSGSGSHRSWLAMRVRCSNSNNKDWEYYGGKGVVICARWDRFENFFEDMGERPEGKTLDRLDPEKAYSPENCRWATPMEQVMNRSISKRVLKEGVSVSLYDACSSEGLDYETVLKKVGESFPEGRTTPLEWQVITAML